MAQTKNKLRWTTRAIAAIAVTKRTDFSDPETVGLSLRVTPTGAKSWSLLYRRKGDAKKRRLTLGEFPALGLANARAQAEANKVQITAGSDPAGIVSGYKKADTVDQLLDQFLEKHPRPEAAWTQECKRIFHKDVRPLIGHVKLPHLKRAHARQVIEAVKERGVGVAVNRTLAALRRAFSWAVSKDLLEINPALNLATDIEEKSKDRALSIDEIRSFWAGLEGAAMGERSRLALRLILGTGQRPGEICGARRAEINIERAEWLIPAKRAKNRKPHTVPLSTLTIELFTAAIQLAGDSEFIFPSRPRNGTENLKSKPLQSHALSHAMHDNLKVMGLDDSPATPHDLRRTAATHMARIGIPERIVGRVLNHGTEKRRTITSQVYIHHDYASEKRDALEAWSAELLRTVEYRPPTLNVIPLREYQR
jgi:integrase